MNTEPTTDSKHEPGTYTIPQLYADIDPHPFGASNAITDLDPDTLKEACPGCFNPFYECICEAAS